jgi:hypothetical protein
LVPVSPSGTGKTFRASISAELFSNQEVAAENISLNSCPATDFVWLILYHPYQIIPKFILSAR